MRLPSIKTLSPIFVDKAIEARKILQMSRVDFFNAPSSRHFDEVKQIIRTSYNTPRTYVLQMAALSLLGDFYGHESIESTKGEYAEYLNSGDTYNLTLIRWRGKYRVQTLGDFVETMERQRVYFK